MLSRLSQNEMVLQLYNAGFFNPRNVTQAMACLELMDFDRKDMMMQLISGNAQQYQLAVLAPPVQPGKAAVKGEKQEPYATRTARQRVAEATSPG